VVKQLLPKSMTLTSHLASGGSMVVVIYCVCVRLCISVCVRVLVCEGILVGLVAANRFNTTEDSLDAGELHLFPTCCNS
jgi:hypothetical protein